MLFIFFFSKVSPVIKIHDCERADWHEVGGVCCWMGPVKTDYLTAKSVCKQSHLEGKLITTDSIEKHMVISRLILEKKIK